MKKALLVLSIIMHAIKYAAVDFFIATLIFMWLVTGFGAGIIAFTVFKEWYILGAVATVISAMMFKPFLKGISQRTSGKIEETEEKE